MSLKSGMAVSFYPANHFADGLPRRTILSVATIGKARLDCQANFAAAIDFAEPPELMLGA
jgi:hypothetical protein